MMPPFSFKSTERVDVYGFKAASEEGVSHSRKSVTVCPRKLGKKMIRLDMQNEIKDKSRTWTEPYAQHQKYLRFFGRDYDFQLVHCFKEENKNNENILGSHLVLHLHKREALNIQQTAPFWLHVQCESHTALFVSTMKSALLVKIGPNIDCIYLLRIGRVSSIK